MGDKREKQIVSRQSRNLYFISDIFFKRIFLWISQDYRTFLIFFLNNVVLIRFYRFLIFDFNKSRNIGLCSQMDLLLLVFSCYQPNNIRRNLKRNIQNRMMAVFYQKNQTLFNRDPRKECDLFSRLVLKKKKCYVLIGENSGF